MIDRSTYSTHADLLAQVAESEAEDREVRRILGAQLTDAELTRINAEQLERVEIAVAAYKRSPWPYAPANHAHRYSGCSGPCEGGKRPCTTPEACERADEARPAPRAGDMVFVAVVCLASWAAIVFALVAMMAPL